MNKRMCNLKKSIILLFSTSVLYFALISPKLLLDVTIAIKDAILISCYVVITSLIIRSLETLEKKKLKQEIFIQHSLMKVIMNNIPFIVYLKDTNGKILLTNQIHTELLNFTEKQLLSVNNIKDLYKNSEIYEKEDQEIIKNKCCITKDHFLETITRASGWYRVIKSPVFDDSGKIVSIVVVLKNIDEEKEIEERKRTFIATLTHDLKTPTISQIKALNLLLKGTFGDLNNSQKEMVTQIKNSCNYMYDLIFTILDTYLYDNGQIKIQYEEFDLLPLINEVVRGLSNSIQEKEQNVFINSSSNSIKICGDRFQLKRVIINLLANAIKYGFSHSDIEIFVEEDNTNVKFNVKNQSNYIPQEQLAEIYKKFKTTANAKMRKTGTGLGLYLSKQIIDAHNGEAFANSEESGSCDFGFILPKVPNSIPTMVE